VITYEQIEELQAMIVGRDDRMTDEDANGETREWLNENVVTPLLSDLMGDLTRGLAQVLTEYTP
jgi:hypothetical protein